MSLLTLFLSLLTYEMPLNLLNPLKVCFFKIIYFYLFTCDAQKITGHVTVNQQILPAIKFGVSQNKVIWLLNLASSRSPFMQCTIDVYVGGDKC